MDMTTTKTKGRAEPHGLVSLDIVRDILFMLPAKPIAKFRAVSKSWHALSTDSSFILSHTARWTANNRATIFMTEEFSQYPYNLVIDFFILDEAAAVAPMRMRTPNAKEYYFSSFKSCHGMLCIKGATTNCYYICNPLSGEWITTVQGPPRSPQCGGDATLCSFYFHASTGEYRLLITFPFCTNGKHYLDTTAVLESGFKVITVGTNRWRSLNNSLCRCFDKNMFARTYITFNGKVHWIHPEGKYIILFDTESEKFHRISLPHSPNDLERYCKHYAVEIEGCLGVFQVASLRKVDVWVFKDYLFPKGEWIKLHTVSFQGILCAPDQFPLVISLNGIDKQLLHEKIDGMLLYFLKLKKLKAGKIPIYGSSVASFAENCLISKSFFKQRNRNHMP